MLRFIDENEWSGFDTRPVVCSDWNIPFSGDAKQTCIEPYSKLLFGFGLETKLTISPRLVLNSATILPQLSEGWDYRTGPPCYILC